jgi:hypothetical protein
MASHLNRCGPGTPGPSYIVLDAVLHLTITGLGNVKKKRKKPSGSGCLLPSRSSFAIMNTTPRIVHHLGLREGEKREKGEERGKSKRVGD